jgi:hypothetical protein
VRGAGRCDLEPERETPRGREEGGEGAADEAGAAAIAYELERLERSIAEERSTVSLLQRSVSGHELQVGAALSDS